MWTLPFIIITVDIRRQKNAICNPKAMLVYFVVQLEAKKFFFAQIRNERIEGIPVKNTANNGFFQSL